MEMLHRGADHNDSADWWKNGTDSHGGTKELPS